MKIELNIEVTKELNQLLELIEKNDGEPRFVGGIVRDALAGLKSSDIDIATSLLPDQLIKIFDKNNIKYIDTGSRFGTITAIINNSSIQITTLRIDEECDGRHTKAIFTNSYQLDASRRDFTINAMSYSCKDKILYDYYGGYNDLMNKIVRFIGEPNLRIEEDNLRILRFFRFSDRYAKTLDQKSLRACISNRHLLKNLSKERILQELNKMIISPTIHNIFQIMLYNKIFEEIMPVVEFDILFFSKMNLDINLRYAALFYPTELNILKTNLENLRFPKASQSQILELVKFKQNNSNIENKNLGELKNIFYPLWIDKINLKPYMQIIEADKNKNFNDLLNIISKEPPIFPINGEDLKQIGILGIQIKKSLELLKSKWVDEDFNLTKDDLLKLAKQYS